MSVDASDLYSIGRKLERVADELRRRNGSRPKSSIC